MAWHRAARARAEGLGDSGLDQPGVCRPCARRPRAGVASGVGTALPHLATGACWLGGLLGELAAEPGAGLIDGLLAGQDLLSELPRILFEPL